VPAERQQTEASFASAFDRSAALLGGEAMKRLAAAKILVVGLGGVGGWCAEALSRTGIGHLVLMDDDVVVWSNLNRQCPATAATIGRAKAEAMKERILGINPAVEVVADCRRYLPDAAAGDLAGFDVVVDAIDSVDSKAALILNAFEAQVPVVSSMGAAFRFDPCRVRVADFGKVAGDGLAKALRNRFRRLGRFPGKFDCVWSDEPKAPSFGEGKGSLMQVTAVFGMCLAAAAVRKVVFA
jgi:tRNA A37 threonylcarbamoyladenosine dehydratase